MTGLEALNKIDNEVLYGVYAQEHYSNEIETIRKSLKALEIIKEKECDVSWLKYCIKENLIVEAYNSGYPEYHKKLTEEEFNLLKGILNDEQ